MRQKGEDYPWRANTGRAPLPLRIEVGTLADVMNGRRECPRPGGRKRIARVNGRSPTRSRPVDDRPAVSKLTAVRMPKASRSRRVFVTTTSHASQLHPTRTSAITRRQGAPDEGDAPIGKGTRCSSDNPPNDRFKSLCATAYGRRCSTSRVREAQRTSVHRR